MVTLREAQHILVKLWRVFFLFLFLFFVVVVIVAVVILNSKRNLYSCQ